MKRTLYAVRLLIVIYKMAWWAKVAKDPVKRSLCQSVYRASVIVYNIGKPRWMPTVGKSVMKA